VAEAVEDDEASAAEVEVDIKRTEPGLGTPKWEMGEV
jgi:hypothetical protein